MRKKKVFKGERDRQRQRETERDRVRECDCRFIQCCFSP